MSALSFPNMFTDGNTKIVSGDSAVKQNLELLLMSEKGTLFGDPLYGTSLKQIFFAHNTSDTHDIIREQISRSISTFMPQLRCNTLDIKFIADKTSLYVELPITNILTYETSIYNI